MSRFNKFDLSNALIWIALTLFVFLLMLLSNLMPEELMIQYSGAAFLVLTIGYARALLTLSLLSFITEPFSILGIKLWCGAFLPVVISWFTISLSRRLLPANPFVFLLGPGFIGLFIVYAISTIVCNMCVFLFSEFDISISNLREILAWGVLLAAGESILEGMIVTILTVYYPQAVALFDDEFYLSRPM